MNIEFDPLDKQYEAWQYLTDKTTKELGYGGAAGGGKSWLGCFWECAMSDMYPGTRWGMGRRELKNLKRTTLTTFFKTCAFYGWKNDEHYKVNLQDAVIKWHNGSEIVLLDLAYMPSDPLYLRLGGLELTGSFVDESNEISIMAINILKSRLGRQMNREYDLAPKLLETFNPDKGHVYMRYYKPFVEGNLPDHRKFIPALAKENDRLSHYYIEQLQSIDDPVTRQRLLHGSFEYDDDPSCLFDHDTIIDLFTNNAVKSFEKFCSVDVARFGKDATVIRCWEGLKNYKTIRMIRSSVTQVVKELQRVERSEKIRRSRFVVDEDGVGGGVVDGFRGCKGFINNSKAIKPAGKKEAPNYANLKTQCYYEFARLSKQGRIEVVCNNEGEKERIVEELSQVKQKDIDKDGKISLIGKEIMKENLGRSPDDADSLMMRMIFEIQKPVSLKPIFV